MIKYWCNITRKRFVYEGELVDNKANKFFYVWQGCFFLTKIKMGKICWFAAIGLSTKWTGPLEDGRWPPLFLEYQNNKRVAVPGCQIT